jgi:two-component sensor histidine kinase
VADELLFYGASEVDRVVLLGPAVEIAPRAAQVIAMAIHELAVNAVEHGSLGTNTGRVEITWSVTNDVAPASLTLVWKERGGSGISEPARHGFGTEVLTKTIGYELKSASSFAFEPDGLRYTVTIPLPEHVGRVVEGDVTTLMTSQTEP